MKYDFVTFGDITMDVFIRLKDARVNCDINDENCMLCVKFGQKIPYESATEIAAVGNSINAAAAVAKIGLKAAAATELGDDDNGKKCLAAMKKANVADEYVGVHQGIPTNYHYVLQYEAERTILIKHEQYPRKLPAFTEPPAWFYLTSLAEGTLPFQHEIASYAAKNGVKLAFQPGTFQIRTPREELADIYKASEIFFCNKEEAQQILGTDEHDVKVLMQKIMALGPKIVVVTDGPAGSNIMDDKGAWHVPMYPDPAPPVSRTGAGDATASTTVAYLALGLPPQEALMRGLINAASVVQGVGAQTKLLPKDEIEAWYAKRPTDFKATAL